MPERNRSARFVPSASIVGLVLLAALDVVLVTLALDHVEPEQETRPSAPTARVTSPPASPSGSPPASVSPRVVVPAVPDGPLTLALAPDGTLLRGTLGGCTDDPDPAVAVSLDDGATFRRIRVGGALEGVMSLEANSREDLVVIGADADCTSTTYSGAARAAWNPGTAEPYWHLLFAGTDTVHAPDGVVETPCSPQALSIVRAVRMLCDDGTVLGTSDGGASWATLGRLTDATAFAFDGPSRGYALVTRRSCPVTVMATDDGGASWRVTDCLDGTEGRAVAARDEVVTALVDDTVWRSEDAGATWGPVS